jgi:hypothetical protein
MFTQCLKVFGHTGPVPPAAQTQLRNALLAIVGEGIGHAPQSWVYHSEALSLEIYRQAILLANRTFTYDLLDLERAHEHLKNMFIGWLRTYEVNVHKVVAPMVLATVAKYYASTPTELFNCLAVSTTSTTPAPVLPVRATAASTGTSFMARTQAASTLLSVHTLCEPPPSLEADRVVELSKRIAHVVLLHWRVWARIAYVLDEGSAEEELHTAVSGEENFSLRDTAAVAATGESESTQGELGTATLPLRRLSTSTSIHDISSETIPADDMKMGGTGDTGVGD